MVQSSTWEMRELLSIQSEGTGIPTDLRLGKNLEQKLAEMKALFTNKYGTGVDDE